MSVVIISKDRHESLLKTVRVLRQEIGGRGAEIVVVEEAEQDRPVEGVKYVRIPRRNLGFGYARNVGLSQATGKIICFLDDDCEPGRDWLKELLAAIEDGAAGVGGAVLPQPTNAIGRSVALLGFPAGGLARMILAGGEPVATAYISTGNCAVRADALREIGGFREDFRFGGEDLEFFERLSGGYSTVFTPKAIVYHRQRDNYGAIFRWFIRRGRADMRFLKSKGKGLRGCWSLWRGSLTIRAALYFLLVAVLGLSFALWLVLGYLIAHSGVTLFRIWKKHRVVGSELRGKVGHYRGQIFTGTAWLLTPFTKLVMDIGCEVGKWQGFLDAKE